MGHAIHFLQRLERVTRAESELALRLYCDRELIAGVLDALEIPKDEERVAIALVDSELSPVVIVTRDGSLVTCLGQEMRAANLRRVTRRQLAYWTKQIQRVRDHDARIRRRLEQAA